MGAAGKRPWRPGCCAADYADAVVKLSLTMPIPIGDLVMRGFQGGLGEACTHRCSGGEVVRNEPSFNIGTLVRNHTAIDITRVANDSPQVYALAQTYCPQQCLMTRASFVSPRPGRAPCLGGKSGVTMPGKALGNFEAVGCGRPVLSTEGFATRLDTACVARFSLRSRGIAQLVST
jgi:hypothetical protein